MTQAESITVLPRKSQGGDRDSLDELFTLVYDELHRLAQRVRYGRAGETLGASDLVHEAFIKLAPSVPMECRGRAHFFALAARAMRQVLVSAARQRLSEKRGGGQWPVTLADDVAAEFVQPDRLLAIDLALERLAAFDERQARIVEYRFFSGLTIEETATVLGVSIPTVKRDWRAARAWIAAELNDTDT